MIKIKRTTKPAYLDSQSVVEETEEAIRLFNPKIRVTAAIKEARKKFNYKKYSNAKVKDALKEMCHNKCAYCESTFLHVYYGDIEHFRPKKFVGTKKEPKIPGYYWLSNDWNNLLLSCLFCNQAKSQLVKKGNKLVPITLGKQNQFPLSNKRLYNRVRSHVSWKKGKGKEDDKARLIINPCIDNPEKHLQYNEEGMIIPKKVRKNGKKVDDPKGSSSIEVYALQRMYLVQERRKRLIDLNLQINHVNELFKKLNDTDFISNPVMVAYYEGKLKENVDILFHFTHKKMNYAAMCRQFVYQFLKTTFKKKIASIRNAEKQVHKTLD